MTEDREPARPLTDREIRSFRLVYDKEPDLAYEVARFASHRMVPYPGSYQCIGQPCRCGLDSLIEGLRGRKRVTPPVPLDAYEQRRAERRLARND